MTQFMRRRKSVYGIRKLSVGACSVLLGIAFLNGQVQAEEVSLPLEGQPLSGPVETVAAPLADKEAVVPTTVRPSADPVLDKARVMSQVEPVVEGEAVSDSLAVGKEVLAASDREATAPRSEDKVDKAEEKATKEQEAFPENKAAQLKPQEIKFKDWDELLAWTPGSRADDEINRSVVPLAPRHRGHLINEKANPDAKVEALANTNSKAADHASVGGEEFKSYAFDYWQYLDSMVFWEGIVPTPDIIDAGHRNGVPVLGTIFYNWSVSAADQEHFVKSLQKDEHGHFPVARKLVDLAAYYGYDGYFINQETGGEKVRERGQDMIDFMLDAKRYAAEKGILFKWSWYDAMTYDSGRYHMDGLGEYNAPFMAKHGDEIATDHFFANFNWTKQKNQRSKEWADKLGRSPYDVFAGLELQRGGSYKTNVRWGALLNEEGKLAMSLGLYAPDTITSLGKTGEDYHKNEDIFWTGYQGDPSQPHPEDRAWRGLANYIADKTPIVGSQFSTSFNTGHGRKWFVDGKVAKEGEWNYRSVAGILPTWRWWVKSDRPSKLSGEYDFEDAYNGGNSIRLSGDVQAKNQQDVMLYSTKLNVNEKSFLSVAYKANKGLPVQIALATKEDYSEFKTFDLSQAKDWTKVNFSLADLAGQTIYGIKLHFASQEAVADYRFNLGQISISDQVEAPASPSQARIVRKALKNAQEAEAVLTFEPVAKADYYEVYAKVGQDWKLLTGSSNHHIYLPALTRLADAQGTKQELKVLAVGKNGLRSLASVLEFDWELETSDTTLPRPLAPNVVIGAQVIGSSFRAKDGGEEIENMLNGTITSLSDKWSSGELNGTVDIRLSQPRTIVRWAMDHAGAGGESINDGKMNTRDFDLYFKNEAGEWELAKEVRGNTAHVTDVDLPRPITAQDWRLKVITAHNGTPWGAIRIYNWRMYEFADTETVNVPMKQSQAEDLGNGHYRIGFKEVAPYTTLTLYSDPQATKVLASKQTGGQTENLLFGDLHLDQKPKMVYYRSQAFGMESSNILAVLLPASQRKIAGIRLESAPSKTDYFVGDQLDLTGGKLRVSYEGEEVDELIPLTNTRVGLPGFENKRRGHQKVNVTYLGLEVDGGFDINIRPAEEREYKIIGIKMKDLPKLEYELGENLDVTNGNFDLIYDDQSRENHSLSEATVSGFEADYVGRQEIRVTYQGFTTSFQILMNPNKSVNDEYLKQKLTEAKERLEQVDYSYNSEAVRQEIEEAIAQADALLEPSAEITQDQVDKALSLLNASLGKEDFQKVREQLLSQWKQEKEQVYALLKLLPQYEKYQEVDALLHTSTEVKKDTLLALQAQLAASYQDLVQAYLKAPRRTEESHQIKYQTIERENPDLPYGHRKEVTAGVRGQRVDVIEWTAAGKKIVHSYIKTPAVDRVVEVGSKPRITKVTHQIKYRTIVRINPNLPVGYRKTIQHGVRGSREDTVEVRGNQRSIVSSRVLFEPTDKIIEIGGRVG